MMILALIWGGARGVEITQAGVTQAVDAMEPIEHVLDQQF